MTDRTKACDSAAVEGLEPRRLLTGAGFAASSGIVTVEGSAQPDHIFIRNVQFRREFTLEGSDITAVVEEGLLIEITLNGKKFYFDQPRVAKVKITSFRGNDIIETQQDDRDQQASSVENADGSVTRRKARTGPPTTRLDIFSSGGADTVYGGNARDTIVGGEGVDLIFGLNNNDSLFGGTGRDEIHGGNGDDYISGNSGEDLLLGSKGDDTVLGNEDDDSVWGNDGNDLLSGNENADRLDGGQGRDTLTGDSGQDTLVGRQGDDSLVGGRGDDSLQGDDGDDTLAGDQGNDTLFSGLGNNDADGGDDVDLVDGVLV